jgi:hypothetical protein
MTPSRPLRALSLGAGVQSTTVALLAKHGEIAPIDVAIFADTQWERRKTYTHLWWLAEQMIGVCPLIVVSRGDVRSKWWQIPYYTDADTGDEGRISRNCSRDFKVAAVRSILRPMYLAQPKPRPPIMQLMGFSLDEHERASDSPVAYLRNEWPLLYERPMTKGDCLAWMDAKGYPLPPKSACIGCPMRDDAAWGDLDPDEWAEAVELDDWLRSDAARQHKRAPKRPLFTHRRGRLATVELRPKDRSSDQLSLAATCDPGAGCFT